MSKQIKYKITVRQARAPNVKFNKGRGHLHTDMYTHIDRYTLSIQGLIGLTMI